MVYFFDGYKYVVTKLSVAIGKVKRISTAGKPPQYYIVYKKSQKMLKQLYNKPKDLINRAKSNFPFIRSAD